MNASTFASHGFSPNWLRPGATERSLKMRAMLERPLVQDLALVLAPGILGVLALGVLLLAMH